MMEEKKRQEPKEKTFTRKQVEELLRKQIADCADAIQSDNLSEYTAKLKILQTKLVEF